MKVKCISGNWCNIALGNIYEVLEQNKEQYRIKRDINVSGNNGLYGWYNKKHFEKLIKNLPKDVI